MMIDPVPPPQSITPSDSVLLACERFASGPGAWEKFKLRLSSQGPTRGALIVAAISAIPALLSGGPVVMACLAGAAGITFWLMRAKLKALWKRLQAFEQRFDGVVTPLQRGHTVLEKPLAMALVSSALLANEDAGVTQLVMLQGLLQAVPTGAGKPWPPDSLEGRLRRGRALAVQELVADWLATSTDVPYRRAVQLAEQGMVTRGLAVLSDASHGQQAVLTDTTRIAVTAIDGSAARMLLEICQRDRPEVWSRLQSALADAFRQRREARAYGFSLESSKSVEIGLSRDSPLGLKFVETTTRFSSEEEEAPVQLLEASTAVVPATSQPHDAYSTQRAIASRLPSWMLELINLIKKRITPNSADVEAAIRSRVQTRKPAATQRHETVDTSPVVPIGQASDIPIRLVEASELPAPKAIHRRLLDRTGRDWTRLQPREKETAWHRWLKRRARARLLKQVPNPYRLLLLRVFGSPSYDDLIELIQPWRRVGVIQHLEGFDTIGTRPEAIAALKAGRIEDILVETKEEVERELSALSMAPDEQLLFERQAFQCIDTTWQLAVRGMMDAADAVVMDLSCLSATNQGCAWEIGQLLDRVPLSKVTLLVNDSTDMECLQSLLDAATRRVSATSPNREDPSAIWQLVRIGGLSVRQPGESHFDWKRRLDFRLEPEDLASHLLTTAELPRTQASASLKTAGLIPGGYSGSSPKTA